MRPRDLLQTLRIQTVTTQDHRGDEAETRTVFCARRHESTRTDVCVACPLAESVGGAEVVCVPLPQAKHAAEVLQRADIGEAAARTPIAKILSRETVCFRAGLSIDDALDTFERRKLRAAPVVDDLGALVGLVTRGDIVEAAGPHTKPAQVRDVMTTTVHALPSSVPISFAIALMAIDDVHEIPIVANEESGEVVGMLGALDVMRWLAARLGYVVPAEADDE